MSRRRTRRTAEDAREEILAAAEQAFERGGPSEVKLKPIAESAGVTHSGLLYHFKSRAGLLKALFQRVVARQRDEVIGALVGGLPTDRASREALLRRAYDRVAEPREAELLAYLLAHGEDPFPDVTQQGMSNIVAGLAGALDARSEARDLADVRFFVELVTLVMYGDLLVGPHLRARFGDEPGASARFRERFVKQMLTFATSASDEAESSSPPGAAEP